MFSVCVFCDYSYFLFIFFYYFSGIVEQPGRKEENIGQVGIIVSNDQFRDLMDEEEAFKDAIENRLLNFLQIFEQLSELVHSC